MEVKTTCNTCRLCLKQCSDFEVIEETHHEVLNVLLLTLDLAITKEPVMCKICAENLQKCFAFKVASLYIEDRGFVNNVAAMVCAFCKNSTELGSFIDLNSEEFNIVSLKGMIGRYLPELNLSASKEAIICTTCHEFLQGNFTFINSCLGVEEQIRKYRERVGGNGEGRVELMDVVRFIAGFDRCRFIKMEDTCGLIKVNDDSYSSHVKIEDGLTTIVPVKEEVLVEDRVIKMEYDDGCEAKYLHEELDIKIVNRDTISECIDEVVRKWGSYCVSENSNDTEGEINTVISIKKSEECETERIGEKAVEKKSRTPLNDSSPQTFPKTELRSMITHVEVSGEKKYQCQICRFVAKAKCSMNRHMSIHQDPAELTYHRCDECDYKTIHKFYLTKHMTCHVKDKSRLPVYKCQHCSFETRFWASYRLHLVRHEENPQVTMFECHTCGYKTCHKNSLRNHVLSHGKPRRVPRVFKCDKCSYETTRKTGLVDHSLTHMHPSEVTMYKCEFCSYESKLKRRCVRHLESHKEPVQCGRCAYSSRYSSRLRKHLRKVHNII